MIEELIIDSARDTLPGSWEVVDVRSIGRVETGSTPSKQNTSYYGNDFPFYKPTDLEAGYNVRKAKDNLSELGIKQARLLPENSILVTCIGASIGKTGIIRRAGASNQQINAIIPSQKVLPSFVYYQVIGPTFQKEIKDNASATTLPILNKSKFERLPFVLPPIDAQQQIVSKIEELFSELDKSIEDLKTAQQQLKVYRQSVLKWAFEGRLTNEEVKEGELLQGWKTVRLNEICKIIGGVTKGRDFKGKQTIQLPYLRVANVQDGYLNLKEIKNIEVLPSDKEKYKLEYGDILYTEGGDKDKLGRGTIWKNEIEDCIHQNHVFRARSSSKEIDSKYVAYFSQTKSAKNYFFKHGKQTTNLASINLTVLSNLPVPICSLDEQKQIVQEIESRLSVADKLEETIVNSLEQAEALRQSILKKAFAGQLLY